MTHCVCFGKRSVATWLKRNGFVVTSRPQGTGHLFFTHAQTGIKIVLPGHGPSDLPKRVAGHILQQLARLGFDKMQVRAELGQ